MSAAIEIDKLTKVFKIGFARKRPVTALENVSLEVGEGEVFGFLGPNGSGKTTTLKLLTRLIRPTSGTARILGESIDSVAMHRHIGYLPEQAYFYDYLTARELLWYFGRLTGVDDQTLATRVDETLDRVGLERAAFDRQLRKFSKGMLQRVGLAQAIVNDPKVLFFDEPMSGLDPIGRRQVRDLIVELREAGKTVFFSTHILADVEALCDRVAILNGGRLVETGRLADILVKRTGSLEIVAMAIDDTAIDALRAEAFDVKRSPGGVHIQIAGESEIEPALARIRAHGGRVISINHPRSALVDL
jgi:ABC-2 type transport system ATP-binding protein